jgi:hypothetical protein
LTGPPRAFRGSCNSEIISTTPAYSHIPCPTFALFSRVDCLPSPLLSRVLISNVTMDCFRDSFIGHTIRVISRRRLLQYPEERDPSRWKAYIRDNNALEKVDTVSEVWLSTLVSQTRSRQRSPGNSNASNDADLEKSKDVTIITWADDNDQGVGVFPKYPSFGLVDSGSRIHKIGACSKSSS